MNKVILKALRKLLIGKEHSHCNSIFVFTDIDYSGSNNIVLVSVEVTSENESFWGDILYWHAYGIIQESLNMLGYDKVLTFHKHIIISSFIFNGYDISIDDIVLPDNEINNAIKTFSEQHSELQVKTPNGNIIKINCDYEINDFHSEDTGLYIDLTSNITNIFINQKEVDELPEPILRGICFSLTYRMDSMSEWISDELYIELDPVFCLQDSDRYVSANIDFNSVFGEFIENEQDPNENGWKLTLDKYIRESNF